MKNKVTVHTDVMTISMEVNENPLISRIIPKIGLSARDMEMTLNKMLLSGKFSTKEVKVASDINSVVQYLDNKQAIFSITLEVVNGS